MKKFSVILLAMAIAAVFAAPAMAVHVGDVGTGNTSLAIQGKYKLDGEYQEISWKDPGIVSPGTPIDGVKDVSNTFMDDDFELVVVGVIGDVKGVVDWEIADGAFAGHTNFDVRVDNYWVEWKFHDNWNFKAGEYAINWARNFAIYNGGGRNIRLDWDLEGVKLVGIYGKVVDDVRLDGDSVVEADQNQIYLGASVKSISFFSALDFVLVYQNLMQSGDTGDIPNDKSYGTGFFSVNYGIPLGNFWINGELGSFFGDATPTAADETAGIYPDPSDAKGIYNITEVGVDVNGWVIEGVLLYTDEDFKATQDVESRFDDDYQPLEWFLDEFNGFGQNVTALWFTVDKSINDKLAVGGAIMPFATQTGEVISGAGTEDYGTEIDLNLTYKLADNVKYNLNFGYFDGGDAFQQITAAGAGNVGVGDLDSAMVLWNRIQFTF
jgi:hypothetical protein